MSKLSMILYGCLVICTGSLFLGFERAEVMDNSVNPYIGLPRMSTIWEPVRSSELTLKSSTLRVFATVHLVLPMATFPNVVLSVIKGVMIPMIAFPSISKDESQDLPMHKDTCSLPIYDLVPFGIPNSRLGLEGREPFELRQAFVVLVVNDGKLALAQWDQLHSVFLQDCMVAAMGNHVKRVTI